MITPRKLTTYALIAGALIAVGSGLVAQASETDTTMPASFGNETWYQPNTTCTTAVGCAALPAVNQYGAGTLHVAASAGAETARSYLAVKPTAPPAGGTLTDAQLIIPLDTGTTGNGSMAPDTATMQVCVATAALTVSEGEFDDPPSTDCANSAPMIYVAMPTPMFTADLRTLLPDLTGGLASGKLDLGILPQNIATTAAWNVVFSSDDRATPPTPPASLSLVYTSGSSATVPVDVTATDAASTPAGVAAPIVAPTTAKAATRPPAPVAAAVPSAAQDAPITGPAAAPPAGTVPQVTVPQVDVPTVASSAPAPEVAQPAAADPQVVAPLAQAASFRTVIRPYSYPEALLIPVALLGLAIVMVRVMTKDVSRKK